VRHMGGYWHTRGVGGGDIACMDFGSIVAV
jgi:hypothetical protein